MGLPAISLAGSIFLCLIVLPDATFLSQKLETLDFKFGPFNKSYYNIFAFLSSSYLNLGALQITPDLNRNITLVFRSGRVLFNQSFTIWEAQAGAEPGRLASFNTSFLMNIQPVSSSSDPGEGLAFVIAPNIDIPSDSNGRYLGLTNPDTDGDSSNGVVAIEFDTFKQDFDPDNNHIGLDIHSVNSTQTTSLSDFGIHLANGTTYMVWIYYDGTTKELKVYMAMEGTPQPEKPVLMSQNLNLKQFVNQKSYFGFAASTGFCYQLNSILLWNLTVEKLPSAANINGNDYKNQINTCVVVGVAVSVLIVIGVAMLICYLRKKKGNSNPNIPGALKSLPGMPKEYRFSDLKKATKNFDEKNKLGQGGFGVVYKGVLPDKDVPVAVKKFSRDNLKSQGDFLSELTIINRLRHKHLVPLLGWCHKNGVLLLVYDYMPNGSLDKHIFNAPEENTTLEWKLRYNIIAGVASALHYLHNEYDQKVVHRDLKASNIMLDANFNARLGDFGLARALENEKTSYAELEGVVGTMGYIAPECFLTGKATRESDVYGFGAVILEVVCRQRPCTRIAGFQFLVDWVWWLHRQGRILEAVDERLGNNYNVEEAERLLLLGLACSHPIGTDRPKTQSILQIISGSMEVPSVPHFKPNFVWPPKPGPNPHSSINLDVATEITLITSGR